MIKSGNNYKGLCPFHNEKTPSFFVSDEKQMYYCFGCHEGGNVINFLRKIENLSFLETINFLKDKLGIKDESFGKIDKLIKKENSSYAERENLFFLNERIANYYNKVLHLSKRALEYLNSRGITGEYIDLFKLGYARNITDDIYRHAIKNSINHKILENLSIIVKNDNKYRDFFRDRIMFPIFDVRGHVIAFGGRTLTGDKMPKYLNSRETELFKKHSSFYGINLALPNIKEKNAVLVLEGYIDVISLFLNGIKNVVATLGTSLTLEHVSLLKRYTDNVYLVFDGDDAGIKASFRVCDLFFNSNINLKIVLIPYGMDPDEFIKTKGKNDFLSLLEEAKDDITYKIETLILIKKYNFDVFNDKKNFLDDIFEIIINIKDKQKLSYALQKISDVTKYPIEKIRFYFRNSKYFRGKNKNNVEMKKENFFLDIPSVEIDLLRYVVYNSSNIDKIKKEIKLDWISNGYIKKIFNFLFRNEKKYKNLEIKNVINNLLLESLNELDREQLEYINKLLSYICIRDIKDDDIYDFKKTLYNRFLKIKGKEYTGSLINYVNDILKHREL